MSSIQFNFEPHKTNQIFDRYTPPIQRIHLEDPTWITIKLLHKRKITLFSKLPKDLIHMLYAFIQAQALCDMAEQSAGEGIDQALAIQYFQIQYPTIKNFIAETKLSPNEFLIQALKGTFELKFVTQAFINLFHKNAWSHDFNQLYRVPISWKNASELKPFSINFHTAQEIKLEFFPAWIRDDFTLTQLSVSIIEMHALANALMVKQQETADLTSYIEKNLNSLRSLYLNSYTLDFDEEREDYCEKFNRHYPNRVSSFEHILLMGDIKQCFKLRIKTSMLLSSLESYEIKTSRTKEFFNQLKQLMLKTEHLITLQPSLNDQILQALR